MFVTLNFMFDLFDILFKSFNMGVAVSGICLSQGHFNERYACDFWETFEHFSKHLHVVELCLFPACFA
jgi:hypothetical protein